jgi:hypothetical protein
MHQRTQWFALGERLFAARGRRMSGRCYSSRGNGTIQGEADFKKEDRDKIPCSGAYLDLIAVLAA